MFMRVVKNKFLMDNQSKVKEIAGKHLGKVGGAGYSDQYNRELLVKVPRKLNRETYNLSGNEFVGVDTWNAYEVSAITTKGQPVAGMLKIVCPSNSEYHVESKSIKLYLNSLNMTKIGDTAKDCIKGIEATVKRDLDELLETDTTVSFYATDSETTPLSFKDYEDVAEIANLDEIDFTSFKSDASQLEAQDNDWGDVFIYLRGKKLPTAASLAKYIVSHRTVSHFHEEICEMVFAHLTEAFQPDQLMVACLYTRRGGLDINPIRATHSSLVPEFFTNPDFIIQKTLRQ